VLHAIGLDRTDPIAVDGQQVIPRYVVTALVPDPATLGSAMTGRAMVGTHVTGVKDGKPREVFSYQMCDAQDTLARVGSRGHPPRHGRDRTGPNLRLRRSTPLPAEPWTTRSTPGSDAAVIATIDIADLGRSSTLKALRRRPSDVRGLRWLDIAATVPLASNRPPGLRRAVMLAMWDDEEAAAAFTASHPLAQQFASNGFQAVARPLRAFGAWPGLPEAVPHARTIKHDGPVIVTTLARLRTSQTIRFARASRSAERAALNAEGFVWGTAAMRLARRPFMATVSVWASAQATAAYAYADPESGHPRAIAGQRQKDFHHESAFIRYEVVSASGALPGAAPLHSTLDLRD
jgi:heme-degrading monooxygenase HmoA